MATVIVEAVTIWLAVAAAVAFIFYPFRRKLSYHSYIGIVLLSFYQMFLFWITIIERTPKTQYSYELALFWSYRNAFADHPELLWENFWNVVLFVPIGILLTVIFARKVPFSKEKIKNRYFLVPVSAFLLSMIIESIQLVTRRGLFEFDDIFHNTLGGVIGLLLCLVGIHLYIVLAHRK